MKVAAFDAKPFERGVPPITDTHGKHNDPRGFKTQLGTGIIISDKEAFKAKFTAKFAELVNEFEIHERVPFCPSNRLLKYGLPKALAFSNQLIDSIQDLIENLHCFYVILPPADPDTVRVGMSETTSCEIPRWLFMKNLGSMFSYMTAQDYLYKNSNMDLNNIEFHIDAFISKESKSWKNLVGKVTPKVFWRGDECNPFIACADIMALLTDAKLYRKHLWLSRDNVTSVWSDYSFKTTVHYVDRKGISIHTWNNNKPIDVWPYIAKPTVFLAIDSVAQYAKTSQTNRSKTTKFDSENRVRQKTTDLSTSKIFIESPVYTAAVQYAFKHSASLKFFHQYEDFAHVADRDIFVYIGPESKRVGRILQDAVRVTVMSGIELRDKVEKSKN